MLLLSGATQVLAVHDSEPPTVLWPAVHADHTEGQGQEPAGSFQGYW